MEKRDVSSPGFAPTGTQTAYSVGRNNISNFLSTTTVGSRISEKSYYCDLGAVCLLCHSQLTYLSEYMYSRGRTPRSLRAVVTSCFGFN